MLASAQCRVDVCAWLYQLGYKCTNYPCAVTFVNGFCTVCQDKTYIDSNGVSFDIYGDTLGSCPEPIGVPYNTIMCSTVNTKALKCADPSKVCGYFD